MQYHNLRALTAILAIGIVTLLAGATPAAAQLKTLHYFGKDKDGFNPYGPVVFDAAGNLYGTTAYGGSGGGGIAYELTPTESGGWSEKIIYEFQFSEGDMPEGALIFDAAGNLYGAASYGGYYGAGAIFELSPTVSGAWTQRILHTFSDSRFDGGFSFGPLIFDAAGNLYGTADLGGPQDKGSVFELSPTASGQWTETTLHFFGGGTDGENPIGGLVFDIAGNLYGTTSGPLGTVFQLSPQQGGSWAYQVLHTFGVGTDGRYPEAALIFDNAGNLYGTTKFGGLYHNGIAFELSPQAGGGWTEQVLHNFGDGIKEGGILYGGLVLDGSGNLYGTTAEGGGSACGGRGCGTVFELSPSTGGVWTETTLYSFPNRNHGEFPTNALIFDANGNFYGTADEGGVNFDGGTVFEITH